MLYMPPREIRPPATGMQIDKKEKKIMDTGTKAKTCARLIAFIIARGESRPTATQVCHRGKQTVSVLEHLSVRLLLLIFVSWLLTTEMMDFTIRMEIIRGKTWLDSGSENEQYSKVKKRNT